MAIPKKAKTSIKSKSTVGTKGSSTKKRILEATKRKKKPPKTQTFGYLRTRTGGFIAKKGLRIGGEKVRSSKTKIVGIGLKPSSISISELDPGAIITFKYRGPLAHDPGPIILLLNASFQGRMHAINLRYVPSSLYPKIQQFVVSENIEDMSPKVFYDTKLKSFLNSIIEPRGISAYRTYGLKGISNIRIFSISMSEMDY